MQSNYPLGPRGSAAALIPVTLPPMSPPLGSTSVTIRIFYVVRSRYSFRMPARLRVGFLDCEKRSDRRLARNPTDLHHHIHLRIGKFLFRFGEREFDPWIARRRKQSFFVAGIAFDELSAISGKCCSLQAKEARKACSNFSLRPGLSRSQSSRAATICLIISGKPFAKSPVGVQALDLLIDLAAEKNWLRSTVASSFLCFSAPSSSSWGWDSQRSAWSSIPKRRRSKYRWMASGPWCEPINLPAKSSGFCTDPSLRTNMPLRFIVDFHSVHTPTMGAPSSLRHRKFGK